MSVQHAPGPFFAPVYDSTGRLMASAVALPTKVVENAFGPNFTLVGVPWERGTSWVNPATAEGRAAIAKATGSAA